MNRYIIIIFALVLGNQAWTQGDLPVEDVEVVKSFEARIANAQKLNMQAAIPDEDRKNSNSYTYDVNFHDLKIDYRAPTFRPLAMESTEERAFYSTYLKFMVGLPKSTFGQFNFAKTFENGLELGLNLKHEGLNNEKNKLFQKYMDNDAGLEIASTLDNGMRLSTNMNYSFDRFRLYGHRDTFQSEFTSEEVLRQYEHFRIGANLENTTITDNNMSYGLGFQYQRYVNNKATRQNDFGFNIHGAHWFSGKNPLALKIGGEFTTHKDTLELNLNNFYFEPTFTYHQSTWSLKGGINIMSAFDEFFFFPSTELKFRLLDEKLMAFVGTEGELYKNTYKSLSTYNPYINTRLDTIANTEIFSYYAGFDGEVKGIFYHIEAKYSSLKNLAVYNPISASGPENPGIYIVDYLKKASLVTLAATASYRINSQLESSLSLVKHIYITEDGEEAYGLPDFRLTPRATYISLDKSLSAWAELSIMSGSKYKIGDISDQTKGRFDFSLGGEYFFTSHIGASLQFNNIFGSKYQRFYQYPTIGAQALLGFVVRF